MNWITIVPNSSMIFATQIIVCWQLISFQLEISRFKSIMVIQFINKSISIKSKKLKLFFIRLVRWSIIALYIFVNFSERIVLIQYFFIDESFYEKVLLICLYIKILMLQCYLMTNKNNWCFIIRMHFICINLGTF